MPTLTEVNDLLRPVLLKDFRIQCRARGLNPGGGREALMERLRDHMMETGDVTLVAEGEVFGAKAGAADATGEGGAVEIGINNNNYARAMGQNVGNFLTDRPSSRVLAPPGGGTQIFFGSCEPEAPVAKAVTPAPVAAPAATLPTATLPAAENSSGTGALTNNYSRPTGQNVGNFLTDRSSSRVLAPPGGGSQITFG